MSFFSGISGRYSAGRKIFFLLFSIALAADVQAGEAGEKENFYIDRHLRFWGMDFDFCRIIEPGLSDSVDTILSLRAGSSARQLGYYRDTSDRYTEESGYDFLYTRINTNWGLGAEQGIFRHEEGSKNLLALHFKYRGIREWNFNLPQQDSLIFESVRKDRGGILVNTFITALVLDSVLRSSDTALAEGLYGELSLEAGPEWFLNDIEGLSSFYKYFAGLKAFVPLFEADTQKAAIQSVYAAASLGYDRSSGTYIPLTARQTFGVLDPKNGCGGMVRGFETRRFDSETKVIGNLETRVMLRKISDRSGRKLLWPGFLAFFDSCLFSGLDGYEGSGAENSGGFIASTGFGIFSETPYTGNIVLYAAFPLSGERIDMKAMSVSLTYGLHF